MDRINQQKSIRETSSSNPSRKSFTQQSFERSAKAAEQQRQQTKPEAAQRSTSSIKDIQVKLDNLHVSRSRDSHLQIYKTLRDKQKQAHRSASHSRPSEAYHVKQVRRPKQGSSSFSHLAQSPFNAGRSKKILTLAGGGDPDDSTTQQQGEKSTRRTREEQYESDIRQIEKLEQAAGPETQAKTAQMAQEIGDWKPAPGGRPRQY
jgi:hypothetical protein